MPVNRRHFLAGTLSVAAAGAATACAESRDAVVNAQQEPAIDLATATVPFDGIHQAGISTPQQSSLNLIGFNFKDGVDKPAIVRLMRLWTEDARALTAGENPLASLEPEMTEHPANLTITVGLGEKFFDIAAPESKPSWLHDIPALSRDELSRNWGQTDVVLQICSDDPLMCAWATRHMVRAGVDYVATAWVQQGFMNNPAVHREGTTPRNLFGQIDGTVNPHTDEEYDAQVWAKGAAEFEGGTSMVVRRIAMNLDTWEMLDRTSREEAVGRRLDNGAPLSGGEEFTPVDLEARDEYGLPKVDRNSHVARSMAPEGHPEQKFKRRPYNYNLPPEPGQEQLSNAGLVFIAFQENPDTQFTPVLKRLDEADRLNEWITHIGSAVYWIPPGTQAQDGAPSFWAESLLA